MSLRFVIIGSFLCAFLCAAIVGGYALTRLNRSVETSAPIPSRFERFQALGQMVELGERMHSLAMESHFAGSQSERSAFQSANLAAHKEFSAAWTSIYRDSPSADEAELIRKLKYAWQHFLAIDEEVTAFDQAKEDGLALEILMHDFETGMTQFVGAAHDLQEFERDNVMRILLANVASSRTSADELLIVIIFSAGICGILAILLERFVARPIQGLTEATLRLADGDLSVTVPDSRRTDQMGELARAIQTFKTAQKELLQASRLASVGQLAAGIAHEINTPIQYIGTNLSFIGDSVRELLDLLPGRADEKTSFLAEELPIAIAESLEGVAQISRIVLSMKEFSHPGSATKTMVDLNHALDTTLTVTANVWKHVAKVEKNYDPSQPMAPCLAGEMNQVFLNLIVNAAQAIEESDKPKPGTITISTAQDEDYAEIRIEDSGPGVPPAIREKIFDPFFTTKEVGKGTGQGLAICQDVVIRKHGGKLEVGGEEGSGAIFIVRIPLED